MKRHKGSVKDSAIAGAILGGVQGLLSSINMALMFAYVPAYKLTLQPFEAVGIAATEFLTIFFIISLVFGIIFSIAIDAGIAALGGYMGGKKKEKQS